MIDVTAWAPTRDDAVAFLKEIGIADVDKNNNIMAIAEVLIHPDRPSETIDIEGVGGFHFNLRFYGSSEQTLTAGMPEKGGLFERTRILQLVTARTGDVPKWQETKPPVPPGFETPEGVRAFDPDTIKTRRNVFA